MYDFLTKLAADAGAAPPTEGTVDKVLDWIKKQWHTVSELSQEQWQALKQTFKQNPQLAPALAVLGPAAIVSGGYGLSKSIAQESLLRSALSGALTGAGGGILYRLFNVPTTGLEWSSLWLPLAVGALIGAGGGMGAYGLGKIFG